MRTLLVLLIVFGCSSTNFWQTKDEPIFRRYTDVEGVDHLWKINMDTLEFPRDNQLLNQNCWYHGGDTKYGGESIKLIIKDGVKHYIIRRVYPHEVDFVKGYYDSRLNNKEL